MKNRRKKGRPLLPAGEKGRYNHVLKPVEKLNQLTIYNEVTLITPNNREEVLSAILSNKESELYYWSLVYSTAFSELQEMLKNDYEGKFTLAMAALEADVPYYNVKTIYTGQGQTEYTYRFMLYFYLKGIDIQSIRLRPENSC